MKLRLFQCLFLLYIMVPAALSNDRPKRDLNFLRKLKAHVVKSIFGHKNYIKSYSPENAERATIYQVPGKPNTLFKVVPVSKIPGSTLEVIDRPAEVVQFIQEQPKHPTLGLIETYLGTKTNEETIKALDGIKNLLQSGILTKTQLIESPSFITPRKQVVEVVRTTPVLNTYFAPSLQFPIGPYSAPFSFPHASYRLPTVNTVVTANAPKLTNEHHEAKKEKINVKVPAPPKEIEFGYIPEKTVISGKIPSVIRPIGIAVDTSKVQVPIEKPVYVNNFSTENVKKDTVFENINSDGSNNNKKISEIPPPTKEIYETKTILLNRIEDLVSKKSKIPEAPRLQEPSQGNYLYQNINSDETVNTYTNYEEGKPNPLNTLPDSKPMRKVIVDRYEEITKYPVEVPEAPKLSTSLTDDSNGFYYHYVQAGGKHTDYTGETINGNKKITNELSYPPKTSTMIGEREKTTQQSSFVYHQLKGDGSSTVYTGGAAAGENLQTGEHGFVTNKSPEASFSVPNTLPHSEKKPDHSEQVFIGVATDVFKPVLTVHARPVISYLNVPVAVGPVSNIVHLPPKIGTPCEENVPQKQYPSDKGASNIIKTEENTAYTGPYEDVNGFMEEDKTHTLTDSGSYHYTQGHKYAETAKVHESQENEPLESNPIVVLSGLEKPSYSYTVSDHHGSSTNVQGIKNSVITDSGSYHYIQGYKYAETAKVQKSQENESLESNPIVVLSGLDKPSYSYTVSDHHGSSTNVQGIKNNVSVNIGHHRGDIPT